MVLRQARAVFCVSSQLPRLAVYSGLVPFVFRRASSLALASMALWASFSSSFSSAVVGFVLAFIFSIVAFAFSLTAFRRSAMEL